MAVTRRTVVGIGAAGLALAGPGAALALAPDVIFVRTHADETHGVLSFAGRSFPCMVGKSGVVSPKHESDGGTPAGRFALREVRYRPDRVARPATGLPCFPTLQSDGWCDDPSDPAYNKLVHMPYQTDAETMWLESHLYDVVGVIGYNDDPVRVGAGSAVFLHVMRPASDGHQYTSGCVSLALPDLLAVFAACTPATQIDIRAS
jgi:L,D-peptidoglycan transpeptidase YkuD (ErfK/YbiS/YcfS/YnhG family)